MIKAVEAHEDTHLGQYQVAMDHYYAIFRNKVKLLSLDSWLNETDAGQAKADMETNPPYKLLVKDFYEGHKTAGELTNKHTVMGDFIKAEHRVVDPMIKKIEARKKILKCPR